MKIIVASDLHLESSIYYSPWDDYPTEDEATLILAGDIFPLYFLNSGKEMFNEHKRCFLDFLIIASTRFKNVLYVPGNHEYYGGDIMLLDNWFKRYLVDNNLTNIHYLNRDIVDLDGQRFVGCALWTEVDPIKMVTHAKYMADYSQIKCDGKKFTPAQSTAIHREHLQFLKDNVNSDDIVITHHAPSLQSIAEQFKGNHLNTFFYNDLDDFILEIQPKVWVHGHTHCSLHYNIEKTEIICNPRGYLNFYSRNNPENPEFNKNLEIQLD